MPSSAAKLSAVSCCLELTAMTSTFSTSFRSLIVVREIQPVPAMPQRVRGSAIGVCASGLHGRSVDTGAAPEPRGALHLRDGCCNLRVTSPRIPRLYQARGRTTSSHHPRKACPHMNLARLTTRVAVGGAAAALAAAGLVGATGTAAQAAPVST